MNQLEAMELEFLWAVRRLSDVGYGRMMQIVSREWFRRAVEDGLCPPGGVLVPGICYGLISAKDRADYDAGYNADPQFKKSD